MQSVLNQLKKEFLDVTEYVDKKMAEDQQNKMVEELKMQAN